MGSRDSPTKFEEAGAWSVVWSSAELCRSDEMDVVLSNEDADFKVFKYWYVDLS